jgi:hypothetical protein
MVMLVKARLSLYRVALVVALAVALIATGFAHRMPAPSDANLAFAVANGASLDDLCAKDPGDGPQGDPHCQACLIVGAADLPQATPGVVDLNLVVLARGVVPRESCALASALDPAHSAQGPPVV